MIFGSFFFMLIISVMLYLPRNWYPEGSQRNNIMVGAPRNTLNNDHAQLASGVALMSLLREGGQWDTDDMCTKELQGEIPYNLNDPKMYSPEEPLTSKEMNWELERDSGLGVPNVVSVLSCSQSHGSQRLIFSGTSWRTSLHPSLSQSKRTTCLPRSESVSSRKYTKTEGKVMCRNWEGEWPYYINKQYLICNDCGIPQMDLFCVILWKRLGFSQPIRRQSTNDGGHRSCIIYIKATTEIQSSSFYNLFAIWFRCYWCRLSWRRLDIIWI